MRNGQIKRVRDALRPRRSEFERGRKTGIAYVLNLLPAADADLTMFDLAGLRRQLTEEIR